MWSSCWWVSHVFIWWSDPWTRKFRCIHSTLEALQSNRRLLSAMALKVHRGDVGCFWVFVSGVSPFDIFRIPLCIFGCPSVVLATNNSAWSFHQFCTAPGVLPMPYHDGVGWGLPSTWTLLVHRLCVSRWLVLHRIPPSPFALLTKLLPHFGPCSCEL